MPLRCASLFADVNVANTQTAVGLLRVLTLAVLGSVASTCFFGQMVKSNASFL